REKGRWVIVSTAHPAKFSETVNPLRGSPVPVPSNLQELFDRPAAFEEIDATLEALRKALGSGAHGV
ncbi:MAG: threonine synthase, partial [Steroidobacteraceae bacterium]